jgi:NAD(P)-dependent dehydrogenase (short-subunit alcohol dehydrogenase family)
VLLEHKNALGYGAGGSIGGAVARAFAREGANVFLAGRTLAKVESVAKDIRAARAIAPELASPLPAESLQGVRRFICSPSPVLERVAAAPRFPGGHRLAFPRTPKSASARADGGQRPLRA